MDQPEDDSDHHELRPWPAPSGGAERLLRDSRWARRRRPFKHWEIISIRVLILLASGFAGIAFAIQPHSSLWWQAALGGLTGVAVSVAFSSPYQIGQLIGLRPPSAPRNGAELTP